MTESEAVEKLKNMRLFMQIEDDNNDCKFTEDDYKANEMAINALEKQIPKKPIEYEDKFYACPVCKNPVMHKWEKYNTELMEKSNGLPVCLNCLQAIDWSDEE